MLKHLSSQSVRIEAGQVRLPQAAPFMAVFLAPAADFPDGMYAGQVAGMSQSPCMLGGRLPETRPRPPRSGISLAGLQERGLSVPA